MNTCHRRASAWTGSLLSDGTKWTVSKTSSGAYKLSAKSGGTGKALAVATLNAGQKGGLLQQRRKFDMRVLKKSEFRIFSAILSGICMLVFALSCSGCAATAYACDIVEQTEVDVDTPSDYVARGKHEIGIAAKEYNISYINSKKDFFRDDVCDVFEVLEDDSSDTNRGGTVTLNSKTGEVIGFRGITPFQRITGFSSLTKEQMRAEVEAVMGDFVDFSRYNSFDAEDFEGQFIEETLLRWSVVREIEYDISVTVHITNDGEIYQFSMNDNCPDNLKKLSLTESERNRILLSALQKKTDSQITEIKVESEMLTACNGKAAVIYDVVVTEEGGFVWKLLLSITQ